VTTFTPIDDRSLAPVQKKSIRFRARSFVAFALTPEAPLGEWLQHLDRWTENSPGFFAGRPVVLDMTKLDFEQSDVAQLVSELADRGIRVYAIEASGIEALSPNLPPLLVGAKPLGVEETLPAQGRNLAAAETVEQDQPAARPLIIDAPVRSGQSIYHPLGDVVVIGSVSSGSEIIAGGSVHVYGTLRGRVFAGATGEAGARIYCRRNEAELLAIDGWYRTADDMETSTRGKPVQAFLDNGTLWVSALD
jgi:septum site-determining protein MinC